MILSLDQSSSPLKPVSDCRLRHLGRPALTRGAHLLSVPGCQYTARALCKKASTATFKLLLKLVGLPIDLTACQILIKVSELKTEMACEMTGKDGA